MVGEKEAARPRALLFERRDCDHESPASLNFETCERMKQKGSEVRPNRTIQNNTSRERIREETTGNMSQGGGKLATLAAKKREGKVN